ncbi:MAG: hypothetical protein Q8K78_02245 [Planctomycetaceae bacterium]|nr:hypothetical protein [Planctomycetaceae bacterium]
MGLTIHWKLKADVRRAGEARALVERLRQRARDLPLANVSEMVELAGEDTDFAKLPRESPARWLLIQAGAYIKVDGCDYHVTPQHVIAFTTQPGDGCEPANFGLCRYPATIEVDDHRPGATGGKRRVKTGLTGWRWESFCKTQYASNPDCGGIENFLRCHLSVIALLDFARSLGFVEEVSDEGNYWEARDAEALAKEVGVWNAMIAGFAGQLKDALGNGVVSAITQFPNFEHLEAHGRRDS